MTVQRLAGIDRALEHVLLLVALHRFPDDLHRQIGQRLLHRLSTGDLAARCIEMAASQGFSQADLEAEVGDLSDYIAAALERSNSEEHTPTDRGRP